MTHPFSRASPKHKKCQRPPKAQQLQDDARIWEKLLAATGGKLEFTKCFYYILQWKFDEEGTPSHTTKQELEDSGVTVTIQEKEQNI